MIVQVPLFLGELEGSPSLAKVHAALTEHYAGQDIVEVMPLEESAKLPASMRKSLPARTV